MKGEFSQKATGGTKGTGNTTAETIAGFVPALPRFFCAWLLQLLAAVALTVSGSAAELSLRPSTNHVARFQRVEFDLQVPGSWRNPFDPDEVAVNLIVTPTGEKPLVVPAFFYQGYERKRINGRDWFYPSGLPTWKARYAPSRPGGYDALAECISGGVTNRSSAVSFECRGEGGAGYVQVSKTDPRFLEFSTGKAFFPIGQNLAFIGNQQYVSLSKAEDIFSRLSENGANYLRIWTCCEDWAMAVEARKSAWGRSWNWRPPLANAPGEADRSVRVAGNALVRMEASHGLALRPQTQYRFRVRVRSAEGGKLRLKINPGRVDQEFQSASEWSEFSSEFKTGAGDYWLNEMSFQSEGAGEVFLRDLSLKEFGDGPELLWEVDPNRPVLGCYNPLDCFLLDELLSAAERTGIYLQLCLLTRDLYMNRLKDPASADYDRAIADGRRTLRYAVARWGFSTSVAAWEYWNEMDPGLPTDRFYSELGRFLKGTDPYQHLRTTSTWGPSARDCRHPELDFADTHFYLRPSDKGKFEDEAHAVLARTVWLRELAPAKPAHLGEFGLADEKWAITDQMKRSSEIADVHNALWASALSGASGTAMFWWWERIDQRSGYHEYRPLSRFIAEIPWTSGEVREAQVAAQLPRVRAQGLRAGKRAWLWCFNKEAAWNNLVSANAEPAAVENCVITCSGLPDGNYSARWFDTKAGAFIRSDPVICKQGKLELRAPPFARDIACLIGE